MIIDGLITYLLTQSTVTDVTGERIRFADARNDALPHIVINRLSTEPKIALDGTAAMQFTDIDVDCKASTPGSATALGKVISDLLDDYTGAMGDQTVHAVLLQDIDDDLETKGDASADVIFVTTVDVQLQHSTT